MEELLDAVSGTGAGTAGDYSPPPMVRCWEQRGSSSIATRLCSRSPRASSLRVLHACRLRRRRGGVAGPALRLLGALPGGPPHGGGRGDEQRHRPAERGPRRAADRQGKQCPRLGGAPAPARGGWPQRSCSLQAGSSARACSCADAAYCVLTRHAPWQRPGPTRPPWPPLRRRTACARCAAAPSPSSSAPSTRAPRLWAAPATQVAFGRQGVRAVECPERRPPAHTTPLMRLHKLASQ